MQRSMRLGASAAAVPAPRVSSSIAFEESLSCALVDWRSTPTCSPSSSAYSFEVGASYAVPSISYMASWRSWVASQMVLKEIKCWFALWGPYFLIMVRSKSLPISSVSPFSMVVWFATPTRSRSTSGSKPSGMAFANFARNSSRFPSPRMYLATYSASAMVFTTMYLAAKLFVATVSSWSYFPWIMEVWPLLLLFSTEVQTFATQGQVVSTIVAFLSFKKAISSTDAPNAGRTTTSPSEMPEKSFPPPGSVFTNWKPIWSRFSFTSGLWMISFVTQILLSGKKFRAS
mmetsp:Transcript_65320/g.204688  ORF Transcript_65320/g.204688 Transcript_65320/m.204688 type:complete len:287 (-) Transcript_65320:327-1187(-)